MRTPDLDIMHAHTWLGYHACAHLAWLPSICTLARKYVYTPGALPCSACTSLPTRSPVEGLW